MAASARPWPCFCCAGARRGVDIRMTVAQFEALRRAGMTKLYAPGHEPADARVVARSWSWVAVGRRRRVSGQSRPEPEALPA